MSKKNIRSAIATAIGASFLATVAASPVANAAGNPFSLTPLSEGYQVAGKEGNCGSKKSKKKDASCGGKKAKKKDASCGGKKSAEHKKKDGKCGEGKCGG